MHRLKFRDATRTRIFGCKSLKINKNKHICCSAWFFQVEQKWFVMKTAGLIRQKHNKLREQNQSGLGQSSVSLSRRRPGGSDWEEKSQKSHLSCCGLRTASYFTAANTSYTERPNACRKYRTKLRNTETEAVNKFHFCTNTTKCFPSWNRNWKENKYKESDRNTETEKIWWDSDWTQSQSYKNTSFLRGF